MSISQDNIIYDQSSSSASSDVPEKVFTKKEVLILSDIRSGDDYSSNEVVFETVTLSNSGRFIDWSDSYIVIPLCIVLTRDDAANDLSLANAFDAIRMKNNLNIIDSIQIRYNNTVVSQSSENISPLLVFRQHTTLSLDDVNIHGPSMGYYKESPAWEYDTLIGLKNNNPATNKSPEVFSKITETTVLNFDQLKESGAHVQESSERDNVFYYDCQIRLADLHPMFATGKMGLLRGSNISIRLRLNQGSVVTTYAASTATTVTPTLKGSLFPVLRKTEKNATAVVAYTETISCKVVKNLTYSTASNACKLYAASYIMNPDAEQKYLSLSSKKIVFNDVHSNIFVSSGTFRHMLSNSISRVQRLVIVPILDDSVNGSRQLSVLASPFSTDGCSTCSPHFIKNFNVLVSGQRLYSNSLERKFEQFNDELRGVYGVNSGKSYGLSSSLISQKDYESNFGYIVCDLSRKLQMDDKVPVSIEITGQLVSGKKLKLLCYIEYQRDIEIDLVTGTLIEE